MLFYLALRMIAPLSIEKPLLIAYPDRRGERRQAEVPTSNIAKEYIK